MFNNAAQVWNHDFYWRCMTPRGGGEPPASLRGDLERAFGSLDGFKKKMVSAAVAQFGSGMLRGRAGLAALEAWARVVGERCDGLYVAFDLDAIDQTEGISVAMPL